MRMSYQKSLSIDTNDGDKNSTRHYELEDDQFARKPRMYNSPQEIVKDSTGAPNKYDKAKRSTLISDKTRVHKGGSCWKDREFG